MDGETVLYSYYQVHLFLSRQKKNETKQNKTTTATKQTTTTTKNSNYFSLGKTKTKQNKTTTATKQNKQQQQNNNNNNNKKQGEKRFRPKEEWAWFSPGVLSTMCWRCETNASSTIAVSKNVTSSDMSIRLGTVSELAALFVFSVYQCVSARARACVCVCARARACACLRICLCRLKS